MASRDFSWTNDVDRQQLDDYDRRQDEQERERQAQETAAIKAAAIRPGTGR